MRIRDKVPTPPQPKRIPPSQPDADQDAHLIADTNFPASQPEQPVPRTVAALTRNIEECERQLARTDQMIDAAKRRHEADAVIALVKQKENWGARKEMLERFREKEARTSYNL